LRDPVLDPNPLSRPGRARSQRVEGHAHTPHTYGCTYTAGCVVTQRAWSPGRQVTDHVRVYGGTLDPHAAWLVQRGMKTLALRVRQQCASALALAQALEGHAQVCISAGLGVHLALCRCWLPAPQTEPLTSTHRVIHQCWTLISLYQGLSCGSACEVQILKMSPRR